MTRIVAGEAGGRRIAVPKGRNTRPTSDRAREGLFSTVGSVQGRLHRVIDLFAGSGAVGLEALSRGAGHVLLVESDGSAAKVIAANIEALGLGGAVLVHDRVERVTAQPCAEPYDFVFADPPYAMADETAGQILRALHDNGWLSDDVLLAIERETRGGPFIWPEGFVPERERKYGEATLWYGRRAPG